MPYFVLKAFGLSFFISLGAEQKYNADKPFLIDFQTVRYLINKLMQLIEVAVLEISENAAGKCSCRKFK